MFVRVAQEILRSERRKTRIVGVSQRHHARVAQARNQLDTVRRPRLLRTLGERSSARWPLVLALCVSDAFAQLRCVHRHEKALSCAVLLRTRRATESSGRVDPRRRAAGVYRRERLTKHHCPAESIRSVACAPRKCACTASVHCSHGRVTARAHFQSSPLQLQRGSIGIRCVALLSGAGANGSFFDCQTTDSGGNLRHVIGCSIRPGVCSRRGLAFELPRSRSERCGARRNNL
jgi:hypothetical protein